MDNTREKTGIYPAAEVRKALQRVSLAWIFGASFVAVVTGPGLTAFLKRYLALDDFTYGLVMAAGPAASAMLLLGSLVVERTGRSKPWFLPLSTVHRLLWLVPASAPFLLPVIGRRATVAAVAGALFLSAALMWFGSAGWWTWMAALVPTRVAGRYFGRRTRLGLMSNVVTMGVVGVVLDFGRGQGWVYTLVFGTAALLGVADILLFVGVPERSRLAADPDAARPGLGELLIEPWLSPQFWRIATYLALAMLSFAMTGTFISPFCLAPRAERGLGLTVTETSLLLGVLQLLVCAWTAPSWGRVVDRYGPKSALRAGSLAAWLMPVWWMFCHRAGDGYGSTLWLLPASMIFSGMFVLGFDLGLIDTQLHAFPAERRTTFVGAFAMTTSLATMFGASLGGFLAARFELLLPTLTWQPPWLSHYHLVFAVSCAIRVAAFLLFFPRIPLAGRAGAGRVFRWLLADLSRPLRRRLRERRARRAKG